MEPNAPETGEWVVRPRERFLGGGAGERYVDSTIGLTLVLRQDPFEYTTPFTAPADDDVRVALLHRIGDLLNACRTIQNPAALPELLAALAEVRDAAGLEHVRELHRRCLNPPGR